MSSPIVQQPRVSVKTVMASWFTARGWKANKFQRSVWAAIAQGQSGLLHASTGSGKTYAVWLGMLMHFVAAGRYKQKKTAPEKVAKKKPVAAPLTVLWITPMRALAADTQRALQLPLDVLLANTLLNPHCPLWTIGARSGDTSAAQRSAQNTRLPTVLITTPESLSVLLSRVDAADTLGSVQAVVVDEWHELMGNKRGVQTQLALARLKTFNPALVICRGPPSHGQGFVLPVQLSVAGIQLQLFTTITTLGTPQDLTACEMRIETYHPADHATDQLVRSMVPMPAMDPAQA